MGTKEKTTWDAPDKGLVFSCIICANSFKDCELKEMVSLIGSMVILQKLHLNTNLTK